MRKLLFLLLLSLTPKLFFAQTLVIVTDFQNCGTGVKDSATGKWVVEPLYQQVFDYGNGYYKVLLGSKEGVVNSKGKVIVPVVYDYIGSSESNYDTLGSALFCVEYKKRFGVIDQTGKIVIPVTCRHITLNYDGSIVAEMHRKKYTIFHSDGTAFHIKGRLHEAPVFLGDNLYLKSKTCFGLQRRTYSFFPGIKLRYGVINDSLREIIPRKFTSISYNPSIFQTIFVQQKKKSGYYDVNGKVIWPVIFTEYYDGRRVSGRVFDEWGWGESGNSDMNMHGFAMVEYKKKFGIIGAAGDTILPFIYNDINPINTSYVAMESDLWNVRKDSLWGMYQVSTRSWILPMEYNKLMPIYSYVTDSANNNVELFLVSKNKKFGIITSTGQIILPVEYDDYTHVGVEGFIFIKGNEYYSVSFPLIVPDQNRKERDDFIYDDPNVHKNYRSHVVFKLPLDGKLQRVEKKNGVVLFINPALVADSAQKSLYHPTDKNVFVNTETYDSLLHAVAILIRPLPLTVSIPSIGSIFAYNYIDLQFTKEERDEELVCINPQKNTDVIRVFKAGEDSLHKYYSINYRGGVFRDDGKVLLYPNKYGSFSFAGETNGLANFRVYSTHYKSGVMDGNGKLLVDTIWHQMGDMNGKYLMIRTHSRALLLNRYTYCWNILDTSTHALILNKKQLSANGYLLGTRDVVLQQKSGPKLFDMQTRSYVLDRNVNDFIKLDDDGNYFCVRTCSGKMGIIGSNGKWLTDTVWNTLIYASTDTDFVSNPYLHYSYYYYNAGFSFGKGDYQVLSNDTGYIIFDGVNNTLTKDPATIHFLLTRSKNAFTSDEINGIKKYSPGSPSWYFANDSLNRKKLSSWQEQVFFDSLFSAESFVNDTNEFHFVYSCSECNKRTHYQYFDYRWGKNYDYDVLNHTVRFVNDSVISVTRENYSFSYNYNTEQSDIFFTVMLFKDGPHAMLLDSLFVGTEWKNFIYKTVMNYLDSDLYVKGNCSNPYMMTLVLKNRYCFTDEGLLLFPPGYMEHNDQLSILIPWQKLKPYLRKDVASKLGVRN